MPIGKQTIVRDTSDVMSGCYDLIIASLYFNINKFPTVNLQCPYREDNKPSFALQLYDGRVLYKDFATGESGNIVQLLSKMWHCDNYTTCCKILDSFKASDIQLIKKNYNKTKITHSDIKITQKTWSTKDINYWKQYNIPQRWLTFADVVPISHFFINDIPYIADSLAFAYKHLKEDKYLYKIYQPLNKNNKWYSNYDNSVISLYDKLPESGNHLIICSSLKDSLCVWSNTGIPCIALQSEVVNIPDKVLSLKDKFTNMYILYDNDKTGLKQGEKLAREYELINIVLPEFKGGKDISDMMKVQGFDCTINFIKNNLK